MKSGRMFLKHPSIKRTLSARSLYQCTNYRFCALTETNLKLLEILDNPPDEYNVYDNDGFNVGIYDKIKETTSLNEIIKLLDEYELEFIKLRKKQYCDPMIYPTMYRLYPHAIRHCALLNAEEDGWKLFDICKNKKILSSHIYSVMMWFTMYFNPTINGLNNTFNILNEMLTETTLIQTTTIYAILIDNCVKVNEFERAYDILNEITQNNKNSHVLFSKQTLLYSIANLYIKSDNIDNGLHFLFNIYKTYNVIPNAWQCQVLLAAIAKNINVNNNKEKYLYYAQKLFDMSFNKNEGETPLIIIYEPYINVFAKLGYYNICMKFIKCMLDNENYPNPSLICCSTVLSAMVNYNKNYENISDEEIEKQKQFIEQIVGVVNKLGIECDKVFYRILIQLSMQHSDLNNLYMYYNQMENKTEKDVKIMAGIVMQYFKNNCDKENINDEILQFKDWVLNEYTNHNSLPLLDQEDSLQEFKNMIANI